MILRKHPLVLFFFEINIFARTIYINIYNTRKLALPLIFTFRIIDDRTE